MLTNSPPCAHTVHHRMKVFTSVGCSFFFFTEGSVVFIAQIFGSVSGQFHFAQKTRCSIASKFFVPAYLDPLQNPGFRVYLLKVIKKRDNSQNSFGTLSRVVGSIRAKLSFRIACHISIAPAVHFKVIATTDNINHKNMQNISSQKKNYHKYQTPRSRSPPDLHLKFHIIAKMPFQHLKELTKSQQIMLALQLQ